MSSLHLEFLCKKFQERFSVQLQKTRQEEARFRLYTAGLQEFSLKILPVLRLFAEKDGLGSNSYQHSQQAVTNLLIWLTTPYLRSCQDFNAGVVLFADLIAGCSDPVVKRRLVTYSNHLKMKWNTIEPGGLSHNPRAAKRSTYKENSESQSYIGIGLILILILLLGCAIFISETRTNSRLMAETKSPQSPATDSYPDPVASTTSQPFAPQVDSFNVQIIGNQVLVPVKLQNDGNSVSALLLLDTGCTMTTITEELAGRLNIDNRRTWSGTALVADGRMIATRHTKIDQMMVGSRSLASAEISIMPHSGVAQRYDGLLGMNFLRQHRFQVDYDKRLIRWQ